MSYRCALAPGTTHAAAPMFCTRVALRYRREPMPMASNEHGRLLRHLAAGILPVQGMRPARAGAELSCAETFLKLYEADWPKCGAVLAIATPQPRRRADVLRPAVAAWRAPYGAAAWSETPKRHVGTPWVCPQTHTLQSAQRRQSAQLSALSACPPTRSLSTYMTGPRAAARTMR